VQYPHEDFKSSLFKYVRVFAVRMDSSVKDLGITLASSEAVFKKTAAQLSLFLLLFTLSVLKFKIL
jgi:hypothetical protein